jgi:hypothetical protein
VPEALKSGVFTVRQARDAGVSRDQLRTSAWRRVSYGWYRWVGYPGSDDLRLATIACGMPPVFAFSGITAAVLYGLDLRPGQRPEVIVPPHSVVTERVDAVVHRIDLRPEDICQRAGLPVTSPTRTCFDLPSRLPLTEAVVAIDAALQAQLLTHEQLRRYVFGHDHVKGVVNARRVLGFLEPKSESPMESRLRMLLVLAGLPRPEAQVSLYDSQGRFVARPDLYYPEARLGLEYDGENHRDRLTADNRRQNRLHQIGVSLLRYTAPDLRERPAAIVAEVRDAVCARMGANGASMGPIR